MASIKKLAFGLALTALSVAAVMTLVRNFATEGVKGYFRA